MRIGVSPTLRIGTGLLVVASLSVVGYNVFRQRNIHSPEALLERADGMAWLNNWIGAAPLYHQAEIGFLARHQLRRALYARVSQMPAHSESSTSLPSQITELNADLRLPQAKNSATRLRILTILGMFETNYDAGMARRTWAKVESLAIRQGHFLLASRAVGEQGIAAFLQGDISTAKRDVLWAWAVAKIDDPAAQIRYASVYGAGLVALKKYRQALKPLNHAIRVAEKTPGVAYPTIAITAKIAALSGLCENRQALALTDAEMRKVSRYRLAGNLYELYQTRAGIDQRMGNWNEAITDYRDSTRYAMQLTYWRGLTQVDGLLAAAYLHQGELRPALMAINGAINANKKIPDELYLAPHNLALKAEIMERLGNVRTSNDLYERSEALLDVLLTRVPTPSVERQLLNDLSMVYSGYFVSLCRQGKIAEAFHTIEQARGRLEAQRLMHHAVIVPHTPTEAEQNLTKLTIALADARGKMPRSHILDVVDRIEEQMGVMSPVRDVPLQPVPLQKLQNDLQSSETLIEYVLATPHSYALAITHLAVHLYELPSKATLNQEAIKYRKQLIGQQSNPVLAHRLFAALLGGVREYRNDHDVIVVPDGELDLLSFSALMNHGHYLLASHTITVTPSATVFDLLRHRLRTAHPDEYSFLGVAAWTSRPPEIPWTAVIHRGIPYSWHSRFVALPSSRHEVEAAGDDLPRPRTILLGADATVRDFERLPLNEYDVIHLALHSYVNTEFPDESALVFAPGNLHAAGGFLRVSEIRKLHLHASLVTLSACSTGVGPVGEDGVNDIVNAFLEAGAQSVVSTLWAIEDQATAHFMTFFYHYLGKGDSKAQALREAQLAMMHTGAPPYFWAGFELDGEPREPVLSRGHMGAVMRKSAQSGVAQ